MTVEESLGLEAAKPHTEALEIAVERSALTSRSHGKKEDQSGTEMSQKLKTGGSEELRVKVRGRVDTAKRAR